MPDEVSKKSLKVLDQKLKLLAEHAEFGVNINSVVGSGISNPHDALVVARRAVELGFTSTVGIIHDGDGQLRPLNPVEKDIFLKIKEINPQTNVVIFYRDIRTYGFREEYYQKARQQGILFVRYDLDSKPKVTQTDEANGPLQVEAYDPILGQNLRLAVDLLVLSTGIAPSTENVELAKILKVPLDEDGFFLEAHIKLRPVDFSTDGVYLCGLAQSPKFVGEAISQARAAAGRAATLLARESIQAKGRTVEIKERICAGCGVCVSVCPYEAREIDPDLGIARVIEVLCQGCGACAAACPNAATKQVGFAKEDILAAVDSLT